MTKGSKGKPRLVAPKRHFPDPKAAKSKPKSRGRVTKKKVTRRTKAKQTRGPIARFFRVIAQLVWWTFSRFAVVFGLVLVCFTLYYYAQLPSAHALMDERQKGSITLRDYTGKTFAWRGDQFGGLVRPETVSPHLRNAVIATEDKRFYRHFGISPRGIAGAIRTNLREGRSALDGHGGSTITQQVAKDAFFSDLPSKIRKIKEVPMSMAMELKYTKDEILTMYLNRVYLGAGSHGFAAASERYFGKNASDVSIAEAAMMAGLLKAPSSYAPTRDLSRAQKRANLIIGLMHDQGYITDDQANDAKENPAQLSQTARERAGGYFADWVMEAAPEFIIKDSKEDVIIKTTFDPQIQKAAENALEYIFTEKVSKGSKAQAAVVVLSKDGAVRAMIGGRNIGAQGGLNRATQALRQTGSAFKPFVYAAALESGYQFDSMVLDAPITLNIPGSGEWSPDNYKKGEYRGEITLTEALAHSINTSAVRLSEDVGRARVRALAADFGIQRDLAQGPALALGASESTLLEMTGAYAGILNSGRRITPYGLTELTLQGDSEPLLGKSGGLGVRVINDRAAEELVYMMWRVVEEGTGKRARIDGIEAGGKTGTTQGARDAWFIGFTGDHIIGVWMGYDNNAKLTGVTGGGLPADIWRETVSRMIADTVPSPLPMIRPEEPSIEDLIRQSQQDAQPQPQISPQTNKQKKRKKQKRRDNNPVDRLGNKIDSELQKIEDDVENILQKVLKGLRNNN